MHIYCSPLSFCPDLCGYTDTLAKSVATLGNVEENDTISRALARLSEVEEKVEDLHNQQVWFKTCVWVVESCSVRSKSGLDLHLLYIF